MTDLKRDADDEGLRLDVFGTFERHGRRIARLALAVTGLAAFVALVYFIWGQPTVRTVSLEFRPAFASAAEGTYPNGLPFGPSDITASTVIDEVFDANGIQDYCPRDDFKAAFFVEQQSAEYAFLDAEFQARLADTRLSAVDRERIQAEYQARRSALPLQYRLVFATSRGCGEIPPALVTKSLTDVLTTWARQSESRRGVLKLQVQILSPNVLDVGLRDEGAGLIRADLIRAALRRLVANAREIEDRPGASLVRLGEQKVTFAETRSKFEDLIQSRLEPLIVLAGRGLGAESLSWVDEALANAVQEREIAEAKADAYLRGLREYSGNPQPAETRTEPASPTRSSDVQTLTPQIDSTFIDRIVGMSEANTEFRQEMTKQMVQAGLEAVESRAKASYYQHLAEALRRPQGGGYTATEVDAKLEQIVRDGKVIAQQLNDLYEEWSRISLRPAAALFQADKPAHLAVSRPYSTWSLLVTIVAAFVLSFLLGVLFFLVRDHVRRVRLRGEASSAA